MSRLGHSSRLPLEAPGSRARRSRPSDGGNDLGPQSPLPARGARAVHGRHCSPHGRPIAPGAHGRTTPPRGLWAGGVGGVRVSPAGLRVLSSERLDPGQSPRSLDLWPLAFQGKETPGRRSGPVACSQDADVIQSGPRDFDVSSLVWLVTRGAAVTA